MVAECRLRDVEHLAKLANGIGVLMQDAQDVDAQPIAQRFREVHQTV